MSRPTLLLVEAKTWRRLLLVALFLGILYYFRSLAPVFICFVILERGLGWLGYQLDKHTPLHRKGSIAVVLTVLCGLIALGVILLVNRVKALVQEQDLSVAGGAQYLKQLAEHENIKKVRAMMHLEGEKLSQAASDHLGTALGYATGTAVIIMYLLIGFVLAVIYLFERDEIDAFYAQLPRGSIQGTMARWFGYVGDAIAITVRMQVVVAVVNAAVTLPLLFILGLPHKAFLFVLILVSGLLPVVGNFISGAVLCYVAYTEKGAWAVGVFLAVTFVLGKIESYYLNPRLASQHVKLPSLVLVVSLLLFEQLLGFAGLFISFPALYIASKIGNEWRETKVVATPAEVAIAETVAVAEPAADEPSPDEQAADEPDEDLQEEAPAEEAPAEEATAEPEPPPPEPPPAEEAKAG